jgi:hypothetical protein
LRRVLTGSAIETSGIGSGLPPRAPAKLHHALCVTGLTRSFGEIGPSVRSRVLGFLQSMAAAVRSTCLVCNRGTTHGHPCFNISVRLPVSKDRSLADQLGRHCPHSLRVRAVAPCIDWTRAR